MKRFFLRSPIAFVLLLQLTILTNITASAPLPPLNGCHITDALTQELKCVNYCHLVQGAEGCGVGYKTANLEEIHELLLTLNTFISKLDPAFYSLQIPAFAVIPSNNIKRFISTHLFFSIQNEWEKLIIRHFGYNNTSTTQRDLEWQKLILDTFEQNNNAAPLSTEKLAQATITTPNGRAYLQLYFPMSDQLIMALDPAKIALLFQKKRFSSAFLDDLSKTFEYALTKAFNRLHQPFEHSLADLFACNGCSNIAQLFNPDDRLMVRSSGKEDTERLANAGGNETVANVPASDEAVFNAMKNVLLSYFSQKSLTQRLGSGDTSIFSEPLTPILLQQMVGEPAGGIDTTDANLESEIPRCGVMFTEEPNGSFFNFHPNRQSPTSGISVIQASFGHNEGVVRGTVPIDTYYIDHNGTYYSIVRPKHTRIIPSANGTLINSSTHSTQLARTPSLDEPVLLTLKILAQALEIYYGKPMDVEFIVEPKKKSISIVQVRPLVHKRQQPRPSYLSQHNPTWGEYHAAHTIGSVDGSVRFITDKKNYIIRQTLAEALAAYDSQDVNKKDIECIIVGQTAPDTSHEATTFREASKPIVCVDNYKAFENYSQQASCPKILVDVQQGFLVLWHGAEKNLQQLFDNNKISAGWVAYPIDQRLSLLSQSPSSLTWEKVFGANQYTKPIKNIASLLTQIKECDDKTLRTTLAQLVGTIADKFKKYQSYTNADNNTKKRMSQILSTLLYTANNMLQVENELEGNDTLTPDEKKIVRLFHYNFLQAVLHQQPSTAKDTEIVDGDSVATIQTLKKTIKRDRQAIAAMKQRGINEPSAVAIKYWKLGQATITDEFKLQWEDFIKVLVTYPTQQQNEFFRFVEQLEHFDIFNLWLHTSFEKKPSLSQVLEESNDQRTTLLLKLLFEKKNALEALNLNDFADPAKFNTAWGKFNTTILNYFIDQSPHGFVCLFKDSLPFGKLAALTIMRLLTERFDEIIKTTIHSPQFQMVTNPDLAKEEPKRIEKDRDKLFTFKLLLKKNLELLRVWYSMMVMTHGALPGYRGFNHNGERFSLPIAVALGNEQDICSDRMDKTKIFNSIGYILDHCPTTDECMGRPSFSYNVGLALMGNQANYGRCAPETLEDLFTFIHQNLLVIIASYLRNYGLSPQNEKLPKAIHVVDKILCNELREPSALYPRPANTKPCVTLASVDLKKDSLSFIYDYPQRSHCGTIKVLYEKGQDPANQTITIHYTMFGIDSHARWPRFAEAIDLLSLKWNLPLLQNAVQEKTMDMSWKLSLNDIPSDKLDRIIECIQMIVDVTVTSSYDMPEFMFLDSNHKDHYSRNFDTFMLTLSPEIPLVIIQKSDPTNAHRVHGLLIEALSILLSPDTPALSQNVSLVLPQVITILNALLEPENRYALNSEIFWYHRATQINVNYSERYPQSPSYIESKYYYGLTPENFSRKASKKHHEKHHFAIARLMMHQLAQEHVVKAMTPEIKALVLSLIEKHHDVLVAQTTPLELSTPNPKFLEVPLGMIAQQVPILHESYDSLLKQLHPKKT